MISIILLDFIKSSRKVYEDTTSKCLANLEITLKIDILITSKILRLPHYLICLQKTRNSTLINLFDVEKTVKFIGAKLLATVAHLFLAQLHAFQQPILIVCKGKISRMNSMNLFAEL